MENAKRKSEIDSKISLELCPHKERCYRRNPHHFKEYSHPHLDDFLKQGSDFVLPQGFPQDKQIILEQLEILKSLVKPSVTTESIKGTCSKGLSAHAENSNSKNVASTSKYKRVKTTCFMPNSEANSLGARSLNTMKEKLLSAAPYNFFYTKIPEAKKTHEQENAISFQDLLSPSLGELKTSLQINFMIDVMWLMEQYQAQGVNKKPLTVLYGYEFPNMKEYMEKFLPNVTHHLVKMKDAFGTHHSKLGFYGYTDGSLRIVVSTANLYYEDWNYYNQGIWISPTCPLLPADKPDSEGAGPTGFKPQLIKYLESYNLPCLQQWIALVKRADFSDVKVFFVASIPGKHDAKSTGCHLFRVADLLSRHCSLPAKTTPQSEGPLAWGIIAQASTIGLLGKNPGEWLRSGLLRTLAAHKHGHLTSSSNATISVIFPTGDNVMNSYFGADGGGCLPYAKATHEKQKWLKNYLHEWKAERTFRSRIMPHIKTYTRVSPCLTKAAWFLLTSANISKAAWGGNVQKDSTIYLRSYEAGVLFLPSFYDEEYFAIQEGSVGEGKKLFPFMYDLPLAPYKSSDYPWCN